MNNSSFPGQRISNIVLLLTIIGCVSILLIEHSFRSFAYIATIAYFVMGITNMYSGIMKLRIASRNGQPAVWHKQNTLLLGIAFLLLGLVFLMEYVIADKLPNSIRDAIEIAALVVLGIPFLFFAIRSIMSSIRNAQ
jgi:hypothetical protein